MSNLAIDRARTIVIGAVSAVAPDVADELDALDPEVDLWDALGLDSMDHLNVMTELARVTGVDIPESDYGKLRGVRSLSEHLAALT